MRRNQCPNKMLELRIPKCKIDNRICMKIIFKNCDMLKNMKKRK